MKHRVRRGHKCGMTTVIRLMGHIIVSFFILITITFLPNKASADYPCTESDYQHDWYDPDEVYNFGLEIQRLVGNKDLEGLFALVPTELRYGPRKKYALSQKFDDLFNLTWRSNVLQDIPPCSPTGSDALFFLGRNAEIRIGNVGSIVDIFGAKEEEFDAISVGWEINNKVVAPQCIRYFDAQALGVHEIRDQHEIDDRWHFNYNAGLYLGSVINDYAPTKEENYQIISFLDGCNSKYPEPELKHGFLGSTVKDSELWFTFTQYKLLKKVSKEECKKLAPSIGLQCLEAYYLQIGTWRGGSRGVYFHYDIHGLFDFPEYGLGIAPLKSFRTAGHGFNYLDTDSEN